MSLTKIKEELKETRRLLWQEVEKGAREEQYRLDAERRLKIALDEVWFTKQRHQQLAARAVGFREGLKSTAVYKEHNCWCGERNGISHNSWCAPQRALLNDNSFFNLLNPVDLKEEA